MEPTTTIRIEGMTCGHCEAAVKRALESVSGVTRVSVDRAAGAAQVAGSAARAELVAAVDDAGFDASEG